MSTLAAIDCGTNSTRLIVSEGEGRARRTLDRRMLTTRLGQGLGAAGAFAPEAVARTLDALRTYRTVIDAHGVDEVRLAFTAAARDADAVDELFAAAAEVVGVRPELLSGEEEGRLAFLGATGELDPADGPFLVVDIGGGSTELVLGTTGPELVVSLPMGAVRITEAHLQADPPEAEELSNAIAEVRELLDDVRHQHPEVLEARTVIGLAGTITTVTSVEIGLAEWDRDQIHHFALTRAAAEDVFRTLATESLEDRAFNPGLPRERADIIVGGCCCLVGLYRSFGLDEVLVSESDILDGLVLDLADRRGE